MSGDVFISPDISIHTSREGGDHTSTNKSSAQMISIHTSREGGDSLESTRRPTKKSFQSTPPAREVTAIMHNFSS